MHGARQYSKRSQPLCALGQPSLWPPKSACARPAGAVLGADKGNRFREACGPPLGDGIFNSLSPLHWWWGLHAGDDSITQVALPARRRRPSGLRPAASAAPVQGKGNRQALCGSQRVFYSLVYAVHVLFRLFRRVFSMYFQCISLKCAKLRACMGAGWSTSPNQEGTT